MAQIPFYFNKKEYLILLNDAHLNSGRSLREVEKECRVDYSYIGRILSGERRPPRDTLVLICSVGWGLDLFDIDLILKAGGYKTYFNWEKMGWNQKGTTVDNK